ncbi:MAG: type IV pilus twitching motility protein PilT [Deltaproteobacteria bacterium]|nr:type IV pilus twitching motility protein PilT [Deltaproteobacteria bacterium]
MRNRRVDDLLRDLAAKGGSDLHLAAGLVPRIRLHGDLVPVFGWDELTDDGLRALLRRIVARDRWEEFERRHDLDFSYGIDGVGRFRANYFLQQNGVAAVFRMIPERIVPLEDLGVPPAIASMCELDQGLVLVTGPTGSGKSTTLAAMIDRINAHHSRHIVTIEDPIEFVHPNKKSIVTQREVGSDTLDFGTALRSAIRQDAAVVLVGEMRDLLTISLALTAAEMGMLVFGTLHTNGAAKTIDRIVDAFPTDQQGQARSQLASSLAGIVSQLLLRTADGRGRVAAYEILVRTPGLQNIIREGNTTMLRSVMESGKGAGMQTMDDALFALVERGLIPGEEAWLRAHHKKRFAQFVSETGS